MEVRRTVAITNPALDTGSPAMAGHTYEPPAQLLAAFSSYDSTTEPGLIALDIRTTLVLSYRAIRWNRSVRF
jgi:hypothetical protein